MRAKSFSKSLLVALAASLLLASAASLPEWQTAQPDYPWTFPQDHWAHPEYKTEWWYFTGHLHSTEDPNRRFGYQFTFFRIGLQTQPDSPQSGWAADDLIMGHAAISDLQENRHLFSETLYREVPFLGEFSLYPESLIAWSQAPAGTDQKWRLSWNGEAFDFQIQDDGLGIGFELSTRPLKGLVFQGPNGYSRKGHNLSAASQYYSFTRLATRGTLTLDNQNFPVQGESWMDKEFGSNQLAENQAGWDWFSLQLIGGRELMLYLLREPSGKTDFARGTWVSSSGTARYLEPEEWTLEVKSSWLSPESGARYPSGWIIRLPAEHLEMEITPELTDQENRSRLLKNLNYWEGAVSIRNRRGEKLGRGYVELTGYVKDSRPPI